MSIYTPFESVEFVWVVSLLAIAVLVYVTRAALLRMPWGSIAEFNRDQHGASYALPYIMALPFLLVIFCTAFQGTLIILAKFGTMHAAYGATRAAVVWQGGDPNSSSESQKLAKFHAERAAVVGMIPFASGVKTGPLDRMLRISFPSRGGLDVLTADLTFLRLYDRTYRSYAALGESAETSPVIKDPDALAKRDYVKQKVIVAARCTKVKFNTNRDVTGFNEGVELEVTYKMPLQVPLGATVFDADGIGAWFSPLRHYARKITTKVKLPSEAAKTSTGRLEVPYFPDEI